MKNPAILLALLAICALAVSLPMEWYSAQKPIFASDQPFGNFGHKDTRTEDTPYIGLKHTITLLVTIPVTFLIIIGIAGTAIALLNRAGAILVPTWGILIPIVFSGAYIIFELTKIIKHNYKKPGIGIFIATVGIGFAFAAALTCQPKKDEHGE